VSVSGVPLDVSCQSGLVAEKTLGSTTWFALTQSMSSWRISTCRL